MVVVAVTDEAPLAARSPEPVEPLAADRRSTTSPHRSPASGAGAAMRGVGRVLLWALPIVLVLGIAVAAVGWYARKDYYVGINHGQVTVFKGVPGGPRGLEPHHRAAHVARRADLAAGRAGAGARPPDVLARGRRRRVTSRVCRRRPRRRPPPPRRRPPRRPPRPPTCRAAPDRAPAPGRVKSPTARRRRSRELGLGLLAVVMTGGGYVLLAARRRPDAPADLWVFLARGARALRRRALRGAPASRRAPTPRCCRSPRLLNGIGFVIISRLDRDLARVQAVWTAVGVAAFVADAGRRAQHAHARAVQATRSCLLGVAALLLPLAARASAGDQRRPPLGARRPAELPARRERPRCCSSSSSPRTSSTSASCSPPARAASVASPLPDPKHLGPLAARVGLLDPGDGPREGPRLVAAVLRGVRGDALHRDRTRRRTSSSRSCCSSPARLVAYQLFAHVQDRVDVVDRPVAGHRTQGLPARRSRCYAFGSRRLRGHRPRPRQPAEDPERVDRLRASPPSARSSGCSAPWRSASLFLLLVGQRVPHRDPGRPAVLEAVRGRAHHDHRRADVRDHRRRDPRDPAHRGDAAVRLLRRVVAHRQLRDHRPAVAHLRRDGRARESPARSRRRAPRWADSARRTGRR